MSFADRILSPFGYSVKKASVDLPGSPISYRPKEWWEWTDGTSTRQPDYMAAAENYTVHDLTYLCGNRLGEMAASSELLLFKPDAEKDPETGKFDPSSALGPNDHPFYQLWDRPNKYMDTSFLLKQWTLVMNLSPKGLFVVLDDNVRNPMKKIPEDVRNMKISYDISSAPVAFWTPLPYFMKTKSSKDSLLSHYEESDGYGTGNVTVYSPDSVMWLRQVNPTDFMTSLSVMGPAKQPVEFDLAAQASNTNLFRNGLRPGPIIEADRDQIDPGQFDALQRMWDEQLKGVENWHKLLPLWGGFKLAQYGFSPSEAEYINGSKLARQRVFGVWGVHPGIVLSEDVNRANADAGEYLTRKFTLEPMMRKLATQITLTILPLFEKFEGAPKAVASFVNIVPEDMQKKYQVAAQRAKVSQLDAVASQAWVAFLGKKEGMKVAKDQGVLPDDVVGKDIQEQPAGGPGGLPGMGGPSPKTPMPPNTAPQIPKATDSPKRGTEITADEKQTMEVAKMLDFQRQLAELKQQITDVASRGVVEDVNVEIGFSKEDEAWLRRFIKDEFPEYEGLLDAVPQVASNGRP